MHDAFTRPLPVHPRTGLTALAVSPAGRPLWPILGGSEGAVESGGQAGQQQAGAEQTGQQQTTGEQTGQQTTEQQTAAAEPEGPRAGEDAAAFLQRVGPEGAAKLALKYRGEAGDRRQAQRTAEQQATEQAEQARQKIIDDLKPGLIALGVLKDGETPDPAKLTADLQAANQRATEQETATRTMQIENAVLRAGQSLGIDADRLLDSRKFADTVAKLDPTSTDFGGSIEAAMKAAAEKDATLKRTRAVSAAGLRHVGGSGGSGAQRQAQPLEAAVSAQLNPTR